LGFFLQISTNQPIFQDWSWRWWLIAHHLSDLYMSRLQDITCSTETVHVSKQICDVEFRMSSGRYLQNTAEAMAYYQCPLLMVRPLMSLRLMVLFNWRCLSGLYLGYNKYKYYNALLVMYMWVVLRNLYFNLLSMEKQWKIFSLLVMWGNGYVRMTILTAALYILQFDLYLSRNYIT